MSWKEIGKRLRVNRFTARAAVDPAYAIQLEADRKRYSKTRTERRKAIDAIYGPVGHGDNVSGPSIPDYVERDRVERLSAPYRSLGDAILGCPPKGYSALDRRGA